MRTPQIYKQLIASIITIESLLFLIKDIKKAHFTEDCKRELFDLINKKLNHVQY